MHEAWAAFTWRRHIGSQLVIHVYVQRAVRAVKESMYRHMYWDTPAEMQVLRSLTLDKALQSHWAKHGAACDTTPTQKELRTRVYMYVSICLYAYMICLHVHMYTNTASRKQVGSGHKIRWQIKEPHRAQRCWPSPAQAMLRYNLARTYWVTRAPTFDLATRD